MPAGQEALHALGLPSSPASSLPRQALRACEGTRCGFVCPFSKQHHFLPLQDLPGMSSSAPDPQPPSCILDMPQIEFMPSLLFFVFNLKSLIILPSRDPWKGAGLVSSFTPVPWHLVTINWVSRQRDSGKDAVRWPWSMWDSESL